MERETGGGVNGGGGGVAASSAMMAARRNISHRPALPASNSQPLAADAHSHEEGGQDAVAQDATSPGAQHGEGGRDDQARRGRRRGRRGGRRRRRGGENGQGFGSQSPHGEQNFDHLGGSIPGLQSSFPLIGLIRRRPRPTWTKLPSAPHHPNNPRRTMKPKRVVETVGFFRALKRALSPESSGLGTAARRSGSRRRRTRPEPRPEQRQLRRQQWKQLQKQAGPPRRGWWRRPGKTE